MPNNYVLLETIALTQSAASVTFDNLPTSGYTDLKIVASTRTDYAGFLDLNMYFNGNASSGYSWRRLNGDGGSATSTNSTSAGIIPSATLGTTSTASTFANTEIYIPNYRSSVSKSVSIDAVTENNATTSYQTFTAGLSTLSTPITSVSFGLGAGNFVANSTFSLYGIAALGTTPVLAPKATGGNIVANDGTYWYHAFTSSGNFVPQVGLTADCLVVAGGGGASLGGGGAGGLLYSASQSLTAINYAVTVGAGGAGSINNGSPSANASNGSNSIFNSSTATGGGGGGGTNAALKAGNGGSGGGAGAVNGTSGDGTVGQGNNGGGLAGFTGANYPGGGGGGAGAVGGNATGNNTAGNGGNGVNTYSSWATATSTGVSGYYAGGGGGGVYNSSSTPTGATGGLGGGGRGSQAVVNAAGLAGTVNTGGGAGGGNASGLQPGGSGIVIIRYPIN